MFPGYGARDLTTMPNKCILANVSDKLLDERVYTSPIE